MTLKSERRQMCGEEQVRVTLFLTNNMDAVRPLLEWLRTTEGSDNVLTYSEQLDSRFFRAGAVFASADFIVSYNYSHIIREDVIKLFPHRIINLHTSMLPWNRGASPNIWAFLEGTPVGVTIHEVDAGVDTGDILVQREIVFDFKTETLRSAYDKSHEAMRGMFCENWDSIKNGLITPKPQTGTKHYKRDLEPFGRIIDYDDSIDEFIRKYKSLT